VTGSVIDGWKAQGYTPQITPAPAQQPPVSEPHWWDTAMKTVPEWLGARVENVENVTTDPVKEWADKQGGPIGTAVGGIWSGAGWMGNATGNVMNTLAWTESHVIARPLSTILQATNVGNPLYKDGFEPSDFVAMWNHSETMSPGQAGVWNSGQFFGKFTGVVSNLNEVIHDPTHQGKWEDATFGKDTILENGYDAYANEQKLKENNFWNLGTGVEDALIQIAGAKGLGAAGGGIAKVAGLKNGVMTARDLNAARTAADSHFVATTGQSATNVGEAATAVESATAQANATGQHIANLAASTNVPEIINNPLVRDSIKKGTLANIIKDTNDFHTVKELILADHGDRQAMVNLMQNAPDHVWSLTNMNESLALDIAKKGASSIDSVSENAYLKTFDKAISRDDRYQQLYDQFISPSTGEAAGSVKGAAGAMDVNNTKAWAGLNYAREGVLRTAGDTAPMQAVQRAAGGMAAAKGQVATRAVLGTSAANVEGTAAALAKAGDAMASTPFAYTVLGKVGSSAPVTILAKFMPNIPGGDNLAHLTSGRRALNMVTLSGMRPNDVIDEAQAYMMSGALRKAETITLHEKDAFGNLVEKPMNMADYRTKVLSDLTANLGDEHAIHGIVTKMERDLVGEVARIRGVTEKTLIEPYTDAIQQGRDAMLATAKDKGYMWDNQGRRMVMDPMFRSQLADSTMLTDLTALDRHLAMDGFARETSSQAVQMIPGLAREVAWKNASRVDWAFQQGQKAFRIATLFRPAYTLKNSIAEPLISAFLAHGTAMLGDGVMASTKDFLEGRFAAAGAATLRAADKTRLTPLTRDLKDIADLHSQRVGLDRSMESLKSDIEFATEKGPAWTAQHLEAIQTEHDMVAKARAAINRELDVHDPGWREHDAASKYPTTMSLDADHAAVIKGLSDPDYSKRLRSNSKNLATRAGKHEANGNAEKAAAMREQSQRLSARADQWDALTPEQRIAMQGHADNLRVAIDDLKAAVNDPMGYTEASRAAAAVERDALTAIIDKKRAATVQRLQKRETRRTRQGQKDVTITSGDQRYEIAGLADPGNHGAAVMDEFSAHNTQHNTYDPFSFIGTVKAKMFRNGTAVEVKPGSPGYYEEWQYSINRHIRSDAMGKQMVAGKTDMEVAAWLDSQEGRAYQDAMRWKDDAGSDVPITAEHPLTEYQAQKVAEMRATVNSYLPTQGLRDAALEGDVQVSHLAQVPLDSLPTVSGGALKSTIGSEAGIIQRGIDAIWKWQATMPEDFFGRFPFAAREYQHVLQRNVDLMNAQGANLNADAINAMKYAARRQALVNTEKTFYTIRRSNNFTAASRYLTVYPQATINSYVRFARLAAANPGRAFAGTAAWDSLYSSFGVDANGDPVGDRPGDAAYLVMGVPKPVADALHIGADQQVRLNTRSLTIIGGDLSPNWTVTIPLETWSQHDPMADEKLKGWIGQDTFEKWFPYGTQGRQGFVLPGNLPVDQFMPGFAKDLAQAISPDSVDRTKFAVSQYKWDLGQWEKNGKQGPPPTPQDAVATSEALTFLLAAARFVVPGSPSTKQGVPSNGNPTMDAIRGFYNDALKANGGDMDAARQQIMQQHGDWVLPLVTSSSKSLFSVPATDDAFKRFQASSSMVRTVIADNPRSPQAASILFGDITGGATNPNVTTWMQNQDVNGTSLKSKDSLEQFASEVARAKSWDTYTQDKAALDAAVIQYGGTKVTLKDIPWLKDQWTQHMNEFKADPANAQWNADFSNRTPDRAHGIVSTMEKAMADPKFQGQILASPDPSYWKTMKTYLDDRQSAQSYFIQAKAAGNTEYANQIVNEWSAHVTNDLLPQSKNFGTVYTRYLQDGQGQSIDLFSIDYAQKAAS